MYKAKAAVCSEIRTLNTKRAQCRIVEC